MLENGLERCNCVKVNCERHGRCEECIEHHARNKRYPPYCKRAGRKTAKVKSDK